MTDTAGFDAVPPDEGDTSPDLEDEATVVDGIEPDAYPEEDDPNEQETL